MIASNQDKNNGDIKSGGYLINVVGPAHKPGFMGRAFFIEKKGQTQRSTPKAFYNSYVDLIIV